MSAFWLYFLIACLLFDMIDIFQFVQRIRDRRVTEWSVVWLLFSLTCTAVVAVSYYRAVNGR